MSNTKLRGMDELIKRLNLGVIAALEVETLELDEGDGFLRDTQHLSTTTTKLINDLVDAIGTVKNDIVTDYLKNSNLYLRSAKKNLGGIIASGEDIQEQTENLKVNLINGFASYVLFAMANASEELQELVANRLQVKEEDLDNIHNLLEELDEMDKDIGITERYGKLSYYKDLGIDVGFSGMTDDDMGENLEIDEEMSESRLEWDTKDNLDLGIFKEKRE